MNVLFAKIHLLRKHKHFVAMKKFTLIVLLMLNIKSFAQSNDGDNLFVSIGVHGGYYSLGGHRNIPYQIHVDKLFTSTDVFGLGYSYDTYLGSPFILPYSQSPARHNVRLRYYKFLEEGDERVTEYVGCSLGASFWEYEQSFYEDGQFIKVKQAHSVLPSAQILLGMKIKLNDIYFSHIEIGLGAPYCIQTSIGIKF